MLGRLEYKWIVGIVFVFGLFMDLLDMTIVNVALPVLGRDLDVDPRQGATTIQWVVTGYLLSLAVFIPVSGWLGDRFGTKRIFMTALFLFTSASLLCGLAWNIESLIAFRVLQGVGGGMLTPVGTAMLFRAFPPEERAKGAAVLMIPMVVAPASGPIIGGYLVDYQDWRWIFFINIPVGVLGLLFAGAFLREERQPHPGRLDIPGFVLAAGGLASLMYALAQAGTSGFDDREVIAFGLAGLAALAAFTAVELRAAEPMIDIRLFRNRLFSAANTVQLVGQGGLMGALFLLPLLLQAEMGFSAFKSGLATFPQALGVITMVQIASRLYGRIGPRRIMMAGMFGGTLTTLAFLLVDLETSAWTIRGIMFARGLSFALVLISLQTATFATIEAKDMGRASAIFSAGRQVAASFGVALLATVLTTRLADHDAVLGNPATRSSALTAFHEAFLVGAVLTVFGILAALLISDKEAAPSMRRAPAGPAEEAVPVH
ncbi:MAG: MDR family MFS transporter [Dehalococcoidia bacterium]|nr:MDR family MFS transporter [Dehalococcoidia bacterium]